MEEKSKVGHPLYLLYLYFVKQPLHSENKAAISSTYLEHLFHLGVRTVVLGAVEGGVTYVSRHQTAVLVRHLTRHLEGGGVHGNEVVLEAHQAELLTMGVVLQRGNIESACLLSRLILLNEWDKASLSCEFRVFHNRK